MSGSTVETHLSYLEKHIGEIRKLLEISSLPVLDDTSKKAIARQIRNAAFQTIEASEQLADVLVDNTGVSTSPPTETEDTSEQRPPRRGREPGARAGRA